VNTIRPDQNDEPAGYRRSPDLPKIGLKRKPTDGSSGSGGVVGGSRAGKERAVKAGDLSGQETERFLTEVRTVIVAQASHGKMIVGEPDPMERNRPTRGGAKDGRKANSPRTRESEEPPPGVPVTDKQGGEDLWQRHKAEREVWSRGMLEALERGVKGGKWFSLIDKVTASKTLMVGWEKVKSNAGACGVDGITIERFQKQAQERLLAVKEQLEKGHYHPQPIKRVWIEKPGSAEKRPLGIPTVLDRVVQSALRAVIEPIFEKEFALQSYGFRPGRSAKDALRRVEELLKRGHAHIVDIDIKGYFDSIPHEALMTLVKEQIADGRVLKIIEGFLKVGVMEEMESQERESGTPQGGVLSPLLANIYLNPLDKLMEAEGLAMVRYADDMVVLCREGDTARQALTTISRWMEKAGLTLHPEKTGVVEMSEPGSHFDFLGYRFWRNRAGGIKRLVRPKSKRKLRETLKPKTRRTNGQSMETIVAKLNPILRGWYEYFKQAHGDILREVDGWVRGRLRGILRKRRKRKGRGRGCDHHRWPNRYFDTLGLFGLEAAQEWERTNLRHGAKCQLESRMREIRPSGLVGGAGY
jgi:RNA-directed DNA polymerase